MCLVSVASVLMKCELLLILKGCHRSIPCTLPIRMITVLGHLSLTPACSNSWPKILLSLMTPISPYPCFLKPTPVKPAELQGTDSITQMSPESLLWEKQYSQGRENRTPSSPSAASTLLTEIVVFIVIFLSFVLDSFFF